MKFSFLIKKSFFTLILTLFFLFNFTQLAKAEWLNVCGSGLDADWSRRAGCKIHCSQTTMSCQNSSATVRQFTCNGRVAECRDNPSTWSSSIYIGNPGCGKTVQIDVFREQNYNNLIDYMVWYTGDCPTSPPPSPRPSPSPTVIPTPSPTPIPTPTPSPSPSPTPASCNNYCSSSQPCQAGLSCYYGQCRNPNCNNDTDCTCDITPQQSSCDSLSITGGNDSLVPAKVALRARGSDNKGSIQKYKFYFGDGKQEETDNSEIQHTYESSGTFLARVDIKDSQGNWKTSNSCETNVYVRASNIESHRSDCSDVFITANNGSAAPSTVRFEVSGFDNKGGIQQYRLDFGTGSSQESSSNQFERRYETAGTYTIRGYIKDSEGNWQGGDGGCQRTLYISTKPLTTQPSTGTPTIFTILGFSSGLTGFSLAIARKLIHNS